MEEIKDVIQMLRSLADKGIEEAKMTLEELEELYECWLQLNQLVNSLNQLADKGIEEAGLVANSILEALDNWYITKTDEALEELMSVFKQPWPMIIASKVVEDEGSKIIDDACTIYNSIRSALIKNI